MAPASAALFTHSSSRAPSLPRSYGEAFGTTSRPAAACLVTATGPPSCQRSSQMAIATSTAPAALLARGSDPPEPPAGLRPGSSVTGPQGRRKTGSVFPGTKYLYSSNTP